MESSFLQQAWVVLLANAAALVEERIKRHSDKPDTLQQARHDYVSAKARLLTLCEEHKVEFPSFTEWDLFRLKTGVPV